MGRSEWWMWWGSSPADWGSDAPARQGYGGRGDQLRSRTQNNVAPATAAGIISTFTPGIISAR